MGIQIFGKNKCFETKKAERYFKERNIPFQSINIMDKGLSKGELGSVVKFIGSLQELINEKSKEYSIIAYLVEEAKEEKLMENPQLYKTPIIRNGKIATVGYTPDIWKEWQ